MVISTSPDFKALIFPNSSTVRIAGSEDKNLTFALITLKGSRFILILIY